MGRVPFTRRAASRRGSDLHSPAPKATARFIPRQGRIRVDFRDRWPTVSRAGLVRAAGTWIVHRHWVWPADREGATRRIPGGRNLILARAPGARQPRPGHSHRL